MINLITNASFNLTNDCNLRCSYCFTQGKSSKVMSLETAKNCVEYLILNALKSTHKIDVSFWGGEPLMEWELLKNIVEYTEARCKQERINVSFGGTTNGVLLTEDKFKFLEDHKIFFMVSFDGTRETHDRYRKRVNGSGSHDTIIKNLDKVIEKWPFYKVRISPYPEAISNFYNDISYIVEHKIYNIMFSPVYESNWTENDWKTWESECYKVIDLIAEYKQKGIIINIEHFKSYISRDNSCWPCGAGRFYAGFDTDGSIYPCHRFIKFSDTRDWREKEVCIGHVDFGITNTEFKEKFEYWMPIGCKKCDHNYTTPCHGGCYAINYDLTNNIETAPDKLCRYVDMQVRVSNYYNQKVNTIRQFNNKSRSCICYNMCYLENTDSEIKVIDDTGVTCHCNNTNYTGALDNNLARLLK